MLTAHDSKPTTNPSAPSADSTPSPPRIDLSSRGPPRSKSEKAERNDPAANTPMMNTGRTSSSRVNSSGQKRRGAGSARAIGHVNRPAAGEVVDHADQGRLAESAQDKAKSANDQTADDQRRQ